MKEETNNALRTELDALKRENKILKAQLSLKERHLDLILKHAPVLLTAFNKDGIIELNIGHGLIVKNSPIDQEKLHQLMFSLSKKELEDMMPHVMKAVRIAREQKVITYAETIASSGKLYHAVFVPYLDDNNDVEYVYSIAIRWPDTEDIEPAYFFRGKTTLPPIPKTNIS